MDIKQTLKKYGIEPLRKKDQFFLEDEDILDFEVELAKLSPDDVVLEIGAGVGNLTQKIAMHSKVIAIEQDKRFLPLLRKIENAEIIIGGALLVLEEKRKGEQDFQFNKIISNIPYDISQKLLIELFQHKWDVAVLCVQREFAEKLWKKEAIAVVANDCCKISTAQIVPAGAFYPPAVESAVIVLHQRQLLDRDFWRFIKLTYTKRNKDVRNVVKDAPAELARRKVHQLNTEELKEVWKGIKREKLKSANSKE